MVERLNNATGALGALKYLQTTTRDLSGAESRLSSGLKVSRARDDANAYHSAAVMKGQGSSLNAVTLSLGRAESISDTAITAAETTRTGFARFARTVRNRKRFAFDFEIGRGNLATAIDEREAERLDVERDRRIVVFDDDRHETQVLRHGRAPSAPEP